MPVPSSISDLSTTPSLNSPAGTESPSTVDDYLRTQAAFIRQVDDKATGTVKAADLAAPGGSALVGFQQSGAGAVARTGQDKLRDVVSVLDFGAAGDGVTNDTSAWGAWVAAPGSKYVPSGSYLVSGITKVYRTPTFVNVADTNHAAGLASLERVTTGNANATFGNSAGAAITTGSQNTAVGKSALETLDTGNNNTGIGFGALRYAAGASAIQNTCVGSFAGNAITSGGNNTAVGHNALFTLTTGTINTAIGQGALAYAVTGSYNVGVGYHALLNYQGSDGVAVGTETLMNCSTGTGNTGVGRSVLKALTTGQLNTGIGRLAGTGVTTGNNGVFVGDSAGWLTTTGNNNTAVGMTSLSSNVTGENNTAIGHGALLSTTSSRNVAVGRYAGLSLAASDENVAIGANSLYNCTTGRANTAVGYNALSTGVTTFVGCSAIGHSATVTASNQVQLGASGTTTFAYGAVQDRSDARDKAEVRGTVLGLDFINALRPVDFKWDYREDYEWGIKDGSKKRSRFHHGLIAQEVRDVCNAAGIDFGGFQDHSINGGRDVMSIGYAELIGPLIKAVQQLSDEVDALKAAL